MSSDLVGGEGILAAGLVDILQNMFDTAKGLVILAVIVIGMVFVIMTWMRTRSLVPTLGALLLGAMVVWGVSAFDWFANRVGTDINEFNQDSDATDGEPDTGICRPGDANCDG